MYNKVILIGNVGKDPEIKNLQGTSLAKLTIATSESYKNKAGETVKNTDWHNLTAWGKLAEIIEKYVKKGQLVCVDGSIHYTSSGEGESKKYYTDIKIDNLKMLGKKDEPAAKPQGKAEQEWNGSPDEDLPF
jgi:single-strand DNA-binding protein